VIKSLAVDLVSGYSRLRARLAECPETEGEQAVIRLAVGSLGLVYGIVLGLVQGWSTELKAAFLMAIPFYPFSLLIIGWILAEPGKIVVRRYAGILLDAVTVTYLLYSSGEVGAPFYVIYLWVTFGNGFRFGQRYLLASAVMNLAGFLAATELSPFWAMHPNLVFGLALGLVVLPAYVWTLLTRLQHATRAAEQANLAKSPFLVFV
jgi:two-component system sensor histidine kinase RpfC